MSRKIFHRLVGVDEVEDIISKYYPLKPLGVEEVDLLSSLNRVLAEDIYAPIDHPPFDRSMVDGYAVRSIDTSGADDLHPVKLRVIGSIEPGEKPGVEVGVGEAVEIATGAMLPRGSDSIVMVEYTRRLGGGSIEVYRAAAPGDNVSTTGSDISIGDLVLLRGTRITPNIIGLLAGLGYNRVKVYVKPKVAVFSTGNEVVSPGEKLIPGKVYDVNGYLVTSTLRSLGLDARFMGRLLDDEETIFNALRKAMDWADIIITSGGTSAGLGDIVYRVYDKLGEPGIIVHGLKIKPGKPTVFAVANNKLLIGLPGFPLSCYMVLERVVKPLMYKLLGMEAPRYRVVEARLPYRVRKQLGKTWFLPVSLVMGEKGYTAYPVSMKSGSISPLIYSDGFAVLEGDRDLYLEDETVKIILFHDPSQIPRLNIIGSNDILLYKIIAYYGLASSTRIISTGSMGGLKAISRGEADIAPIHLLDKDTLEYNKPFIEREGLSDKVVLVRGYDRRIGIVVARGNPKNIKGIEDFLREDIVIVNRTRGSGIRVFLDYKLEEIASRKGIEFDKLIKNIKGYFHEVKTHTAVAAAIAQGRADAGIAVEAAAKMYDLDFIPLTWEKYDFTVLKKSIGKEDVKRFINILRNNKEEIKGLTHSCPGYRIPNDIGEIIS
jgi:molybdenum cofactor synthesis domain-containing protein